MGSESKKGVKRDAPVGLGNREDGVQDMGEKWMHLVCGIRLRYQETGRCEAKGAESKVGIWALPGLKR